MIGTLWPIADGPTARFMAAFYDHLEAADGDASAALAATQADFRASRHFRAPRYGAGFALIVFGNAYRDVLGG